MLLPTSLMLVMTDVVVNVANGGHLGVMMADAVANVVDYGHCVRWLMLLPLWLME